jgi:hypothetical protein
MPAGETGRVLDLIKRKYGIVGWILAYRARRNPATAVAIRISLDVPAPGNE